MSVVEDFISRWAKEKLKAKEDLEKVVETKGKWKVRLLEVDDENRWIIGRLAGLGFSWVKIIWNFYGEEISGKRSLDLPF